MMIPNANIVQAGGSCWLDMDSFVPELSQNSVAFLLKNPEHTISKRQDPNVDSVSGVP